MTKPTKLTLRLHPDHDADLILWLASLNVAVNRLKEKIDPDKSKHYIKSIRGVGYQVC